MSIYCAHRKTIGPGTMSVEIFGDALVLIKDLGTITQVFAGAGSTFDCDSLAVVTLTRMPDGAGWTLTLKEHEDNMIQLQAKCPWCQELFRVPMTREMSAKGPFDATCDRCGKPLLITIAATAQLPDVTVERGEEMPPNADS